MPLQPHKTNVCCPAFAQKLGDDGRKKKDIRVAYAKIEDKVTPSVSAGFLGKGPCAADTGRCASAGFFIKRFCSYLISLHP
jgi:hypothetical protein